MFWAVATHATSFRSSNTVLNSFNFRRVYRSVQPRRQFITSVLYNTVEIPSILPNLSNKRTDLTFTYQLKGQGDGGVSAPDSGGKSKCKILLIFSRDGVDAADEFVRIANTVEHSEVVPDVFRLNEVSLWYEVLTDPQGCCLKWAYEADYIMPVLTPMFLQEIHCNSGSNLNQQEGADEGLLPTSPMLNRYLYILARSQYTQAGSKNLKVRPLIPPSVLRQVRMSNAVKIDPLLNSSWAPLNEERVKRRLNGMLKEWLRRQQLS